VLVAQATLVLAEQNLATLDEIERLQRVRAEKGDISAARAAAPAGAALRVRARRR